jgi:hypothetical protein
MRQKSVPKIQALTGLFMLGCSAPGKDLCLSFGGLY